MSARHAFAGAAAALVFRAILGTARFRPDGQSHWRQFAERGEPVIFVLWHGRLLPLSYYHRDQGLVTLISESRDGDYVANLVRHWGYVTVRGSSSRGGERAFRELLRHARKGASIALTPDGPRGPRERIKPGVLLLAQRTGLPLVPIAAGTRRAWWFESWDRFLVPKPFSQIRVAYGAPHYISRDVGTDGLERARVRLEEAMADVMVRADARED